ncbi:hypothetical protein OIO89_00625 (plasmid) [Mycobacterium ulcerans]|nr:hypothetical protein OIO89_00625 [Mycobacterium ulcerans]
MPTPQRDPLWMSQTDPAPGRECSHAPQWQYAAPTNIACVTPHPTPLPRQVESQLTTTVEALLAATVDSEYHYTQVRRYGSE